MCCTTLAVAPLMRSSRVFSLRSWWCEPEPLEMISTPARASPMCGAWGVKSSSQVSAAWQHTVMIKGRPSDDERKEVLCTGGQNGKCLGCSTTHLSQSKRRACIYQEWGRRKAAVGLLTAVAMHHTWLFEGQHHLSDLLASSHISYVWAWDEMVCGSADQ